MKQRAFLCACTGSCILQLIPADGLLENPPHWWLFNATIPSKMALDLQYTYSPVGHILYNTDDTHAHCQNNTIVELIWGSLAYLSVSCWSNICSSWLDEYGHLYQTTHYMHCKRSTIHLGISYIWVYKVLFLISMGLCAVCNVQHFLIRCKVLCGLLKVVGYLLTTLWQPFVGNGSQNAISLQMIGLEKDLECRPRL